MPADRSFVAQNDRERAPLNPTRANHRREHLDEIEAAPAKRG